MERSIILVTENEKTEFAGAANDVDYKKALDISKKITGERGSNVTTSENIISVLSENAAVDFIPADRENIDMLKNGGIL